MNNREYQVKGLYEDMWNKNLIKKKNINSDYIFNVGNEFVFKSSWIDRFGFMAYSPLWVI